MLRVKKAKHFIIVLWRLITSMATMVITSYIIVYHESLLLLGTLESIVVTLVTKEASDVR